MSTECQRPDVCSKSGRREWSGRVPWYLVPAAVLTVHVRHGSCPLRVELDGETHIDRLSH